MRFNGVADDRHRDVRGVALDREAAGVEHELGVDGRRLDRGPEVLRGGVERLRVPREPRANCSAGANAGCSASTDA
jgi:hypothetical protein